MFFKKSPEEELEKLGYKCQDLIKDLIRFGKKHPEYAYYIRNFPWMFEILKDFGTEKFDNPLANTIVGFMKQGR